MSGWADLECADYSEYIRRLRAFGCPETTLRDLVVTDLHAVVAQEQARLLQANPRLLRRSAVARREVAKALADLADREHSTLSSLLGPRWSEGLPYRIDPPSIDDSFVSWLPAEVGHQVQAIEQAYATWETQFDAIRATLPPEQVEAELKAARGSRDAQLRQSLSEEEWTDYELISTEVGRSVSERAERMSLSEEELAELLRLERATEEALDAFGSVEADSESWRLLEDADEKRERLLGPERARLYQQLQNPAFAEIHDYTRGKGLDGESANLVYSLHETLVSSVEALVDQAAELSIPDAGAIAQVHAEILGQLSGILGEDGLAAYQSRVLAKDSQLVEWLNLGESGPIGIPAPHP